MKGALMCCEDEYIPPQIADMLARYRTQLAERGFDWGNEEEGSLLKLWARARVLCDHEKWMEIAGKVGPAVAQERKAPGSSSLAWDLFSDLVIGALPVPLPPGIAVDNRGTVTLRELLPYVLATQPTVYQVLTIRDDLPLDVYEAAVTAEHPDLVIDGRHVRAVEPVASGRLILVSDAPSRWTILDEREGSWFPDDALRKYDFHGRPFFHGNNLAVEVPAGRVTVHVARGCEFRPVSIEVDAIADTQTTVQLSPVRLYDAARDG